jgi:hypothetical protein
MLVCQIFSMASNQQRSCRHSRKKPNIRVVYLSIRLLYARSTKPSPTIKVQRTVSRTNKMKPPSKRNSKLLHYTTSNITNQPQPHLPPLISRANSNLLHHTTEKFYTQLWHDPTTFNNPRHSQHKYATLSSRSVLLCPFLLLPRPYYALLLPDSALLCSLLPLAPLLAPPAPALICPHLPCQCPHLPCSVHP